MAFSHRWKVVGDRHREVPAQLQAELSLRLRVDTRSRKSTLAAQRSGSIGRRRIVGDSQVVVATSRCQYILGDGV